ncbi:putative galactinol--sucrose galactosyltransferase [Arabidopsis thaliana]
MGTNGKEIPCETQFLIVEANKGSGLGGGDESSSYVVFLPILEGDFRAVFQGNEANELEICLESGDPTVDQFERSHLVFMPDMLNWFGWCTWDAFYRKVLRGTPDLKAGVVTPKFVIIDDGWQSVGMDETSVEFNADSAANFANRLTHIKEKHKFQKDGKEGHRVDDPALSLGHVITDIKRNNSLKYVYVWHAITGYWGGFKPSVSGMEHYESKVAYPVS